MPAAEPPEPRRQPVRAFIGRHQGLVGTALFVGLGGGGIAAWHRWDLWWLENSLVQGALILVASIGILALFYWAEGALPPHGGRRGRRRSRGERESHRPARSRPRARRSRRRRRK
ncbi:hypothetical protein [Plantactinospora sp. B5E13]|uniref:hypothetical protein n=1 Tax=unclassified Plantactinospora TaxID=2631981 RepID=UPI00325DBD12